MISVNNNFEQMRRLFGNQTLLSYTDSYKTNQVPRFRDRYVNGAERRGWQKNSQPPGLATECFFTIRGR